MAKKKKAVGVPPLRGDEFPNCCHADQFKFKTTNDLPPLTEIIGQDRALEAIRFGLDMDNEGYNLFVLGPPGVGKFTAINQYLGKAAEPGPVPNDWCYVNNFRDDSKPILVELPAGRGRVLHDDMDHLVEDLKNAIPQAFNSDEYKARVLVIETELQEKQSKAFGELKEAADVQSIEVVQAEGDISFIPKVDGEPVTPEVFEKLPEKTQKEMEANVDGLREHLRNIAQRLLPEWRKEARERFQKLNHETTLEAVGLYIESLSKTYADLPQLLNYLNDVQHDIVANAMDFRPVQIPPGMDGAMAREAVTHNALARYQVNLILDNGAASGKPVVYEEHPNYANLVGRIENRAVMGTLVTDFTLIKPGALHRANGGYLILEARKLLMQPYAWEALKQAIYKKELRLESLEQALSMVSTVSLEPEPMPLDVKVILLGDRRLYHMLYAYDPDFAELFKVPADFEASLDRNPENDELYARMIATIVQQKKLKPFDRSAVAATVQQSMRFTADAEKLSTHMRSIADLIAEADYWAGKAKRKTVSGDDVRKAIETQIERIDRVRDQVHEGILRDSIMIDTEGAVIGQVNGLSVLQMGNFSFGQPSRITATTRLGDGRVIDIARETDMGGPTHTKGVFTLSSILGARYGQKQPMALTASLAFEQNYGGVDGDSASTAELCTLLSSLAQAPIKQCFAITGSINQLGQVQVIGGVSEKVEGFYDICKARGLTGEQGVLIPKNNIPNLLLRHDVLEAIEAGKFAVYPISGVDEAIEVLTGIPAGEPDAEGDYPPDTINGRVQARLREFAELRRSFGRDDKEEKSEAQVHIEAKEPELPGEPRPD
ncbi:MAG: ATP-binding protein [Porticoccaceae bacterium]